jgi:hypothetical protein
LWDLIDQGITININDILIDLVEEIEYQCMVMEVLERLNQSNIAVFKDRCNIHKGTFDFLSYVISQNIIAMSQDKFQIIRD